MFGLGIGRLGLTSAKRPVPPAHSGDLTEDDGTTTLTADDGTTVLTED